MFSAKSMAKFFYTKLRGPTQRNVEVSVTISK